VKNVDEIENLASVKLEVWLDFISKLIEAAAWPIAIFGTAFMFRHELRSVAANLKRLKWGGAEAVFDEGVAEAKEVAKTLDPVEAKAANANDQETFTLLQKAEVSPTLAVIEAYKKVEEKLFQLAKWYGVELESNITSTSGKRLYPRGIPPSVVYRSLHKSGWLSDAEMNMLNRLRETRNLAANSRNRGISIESAKDFVRLAGSLEDAINSKLENS
jgi:hypothetical protein